MRKTLASLLSLSLLCLASVAVADTELDKNTLSGTTTVSLSVDTVDSYTVVIPSEVVIDPTTQHGSGTITLKSGWVLGGDSYSLKVRLTDAENGIGTDTYNISNSSASCGAINNSASYQNFVLKNKNEGADAKYAIKASNAPAPFTANSSVTSYGYYVTASGSYNVYHWGTQYSTFDLISVIRGGDNTTDQTCDLDFYVDTLPLAGEYEDTLTFSIITGTL